MHSFDSRNDFVGFFVITKSDKALTGEPGLRSIQYEAIAIPDKRHGAAQQVHSRYTCNLKASKVNHTVKLLLGKQLVYSLQG